MSAPTDADDLLTLALALDESAAEDLIFLNPRTWAIVARVLTAAGRPVRSVATPDDYEPGGAD